MLEAANTESDLKKSTLRDRLWRITANTLGWRDWAGQVAAIAILTFLLQRTAPGLIALQTGIGLMLLVTLRTAIMRAIYNNTLKLTLAVRTLALGSIIAVGLGFGASIAYWMPADNYALQLLMVGVAVMVAAGSVSAVGSRPIANLLFPAAIFAPIGWRWFGFGGDFSVPAVLIVSSCTTAFCISGFRVRSLLLRQIGLQQHNVALVRRLSEEKAQVEVAHQESVSTADQLRHAAHHDVLTGLPNRGLFHELLGNAVARWQRLDGKFAVLFLDLDRFKAINDEHGHERGDLLLKQFAARLRAAVRTADTVARLAGDEFVILLEGASNTADLSTAAQNILRRCEAAYELNGVRLTCLPSIGIAIYPNHGANPADLLNCADQAMYQAKQAGRGTFRIFENQTDLSQQDHRKLLSDLTDAVDQQRLELDWQPLVDLRGQRFSGVEAYLRWQHPAMGPTPGGSFIGMARSSGLIVPIGAWVIPTALQQLAHWQAQYQQDLQLTINLSAAELRAPMLIHRIEEALAATGVDGNSLLLDINESVVLQNTQRVREVSDRLAPLGVALTIDDYGSSGLAPNILQQLAIRRVKIDISIVRQLDFKPETSDLVRSLSAMAMQLGLEVGAEGVETAQQACLLRNAGCQHLQGFLFGAPRSAAETSDLLQQGYSEPKADAVSIFRSGPARSNIAG